MLKSDAFMFTISNNDLLCPNIFETQFFFWIEWFLRLFLFSSGRYILMSNIQSLIIKFCNLSKKLNNQVSTLMNTFLNIAFDLRQRPKIGSILKAQRAVGAFFMR